MYRLSDALVAELMPKVKKVEVFNDGERAYTHASENSIGIIDPHAAIGTEFHYIIESPVPVLYPELPFVKMNVHGFFLYKHEELVPLDGAWTLKRSFVDPICANHEEDIDAGDCAIKLPSDIDKLTCKTISTMEQLIKHEPLILDCLNLDKR